MKTPSQFLDLTNCDLLSPLGKIEVHVKGRPCLAWHTKEHTRCGKKLKYSELFALLIEVHIFLNDGKVLRHIS